VGIDVGDWIKSDTPGIWRVYRVIPVMREMRYSLSARQKKSRRVLVFFKRMIDANGVRAFATKCCEQSLVSPLSEIDREKLDLAISEDPDLLSAFERYVPRRIDLIVNVAMQVPKMAELESFCSSVLAPALAAGMSMEQVLQMMKDAELECYVGKYPINATLQMVCSDHEVREGEFVLRACRVLPF
jgi:hypothetical protein